MCIGIGLLYFVLGVGMGARGMLAGWLGFSFFVVGLAYSFRAPRLMGKRPDGTFHLLGLVVHAPFLAATWAYWQWRRRRGEPVWNEVSPGIYVGRMAAVSELPPGSPHVVDLTVELIPSRAIRRGSYRCLPTLDATAPEEKAFWALVDALAVLEGPLFIHCAAGHGRSATVAAAVLMRRGLAADADAAEKQMQVARPRVRLNQDQRRLLARRGSDLL